MATLWPHTHRVGPPCRSRRLWRYHRTPPGLCGGMVHRLHSQPAICRRPTLAAVRPRSAQCCDWQRARCRAAETVSKLSKARPGGSHRFGGDIHGGRRERESCCSHRMAILSGALATRATRATHATRPRAPQPGHVDARTNFPSPRHLHGPPTSHPRRLPRWPRWAPSPHTEYHPFPPLAQTPSVRRTPSPPAHPLRHLAFPDPSCYLSCASRQIRSPTHASMRANTSCVTSGRSSNSMWRAPGITSRRLSLVMARRTNSSLLSKSTRTSSSP